MTRWFIYLFYLKWKYVENQNIINSNIFLGNLRTSSQIVVKWSETFGELPKIFENLADWKNHLRFFMSVIYTTKRIIYWAAWENKQISLLVYKAISNVSLEMSNWSLEKNLLSSIFDLRAPMFYILYFISVSTFWGAIVWITLLSFVFLISLQDNFCCTSMLDVSLDQQRIEERQNGLEQKVGKYLGWKPGGPSVCGIFSVDGQLKTRLEQEIFKSIAREHT